MTSDGRSTEAGKARGGGAACLRPAALGRSAESVGRGRSGKASRTCKNGAASNLAAGEGTGRARVQHGQAEASKETDGGEGTPRKSVACGPAPSPPAEHPCCVKCKGFRRPTPLGSGCRSRPGRRGRRARLANRAVLKQLAGASPDGGDSAPCRSEHGKRRGREPHHHIRNHGNSSRNTVNPVFRAADRNLRTIE